jgi:phosphatidate cytidylyltransferase
VTPADQSISPKWGDLGVRLFSAVVLIPAVLVDVWVGGIWFQLFVALLAILVAYEWTVMAHGRSSSQFAIHAAAALCGVFLPMETGLPGTSFAVFILATASAVLAQFQGRPTSIWTYLGVPYAAIPGAALVVLRADEQMGLLAILWLLSIVWAADTCAYFAGRLIGGPRLAPVISPKKTWSGLAGAVAGSVVATVIFVYAAELGDLGILGVLAGTAALVEQAGDLFKSALKRHFGVKDSGRLIPGHGGVIDRVDGLIAVSAFAAGVGFIRAGLYNSGQGLLLW